MVGNVNPGGLADIRRTMEAAGPADVVETEMAVLQRALERLARRSDIHRDLDRASYLLARTLEAVGPISLKDLAGRLGLDATTVTRQIAAMETRGLVDRRASPGDGRVSLIGLSGAGHRTMRAVQRARRQRVQVLLSDWPAEDQAQLGRLLAKLSDAICDLEHTIPAT